jgi:putative protein-disulfide isomerase
MHEITKPLVLYVHDALCGWCYGFSPVIKKAAEVFENDFHFVAVSGGMIIGDAIGPIGKMSDYIKKAYPRVEETTGIKFGEGYIRIVEQGSYILNSVKPAMAMSAFKSFLPFKSVDFAHDLHKAHMGEGKNLNEREAYLEIIRKYGIDEEEFLKRANSDECKEQTYREFEEIKHIGLTGFPSVLLQHDQDVFLISQGYIDYETLAQRLAAAQDHIRNQK